MEHAPLSRRFPTNPNEYKLYEEIGEGVSATVYRALCVPLDIMVAIKVLDLEKCNNDLHKLMFFPTKENIGKRQGQSCHRKALFVLAEH